MDLKGKTVTLRPLVVGDAEITLKWRLSDRARLLNKGAQTVDQQREWIITSEKNGDLNFLLEYRQSPVGMISLYDISTIHRNAAIGRLLIGEKIVVENAPVAVESEVMLLDYAFQSLGLHKVYGVVRGDNPGVIRLHSYSGYHQDGVLRDHFCGDGGYVDGIMVSLLENEYWESCRPKLVTMIDLLSKYLPK